MGRARGENLLQEDITSSFAWEEVRNARRDWATLYLEHRGLPRPDLEVFDWLGPRNSLTFAMALQEKKEHLYFGLHGMGSRNRSYYAPEQVFLHDGMYAYDALGQHIMPYHLPYSHSHTDHNLDFLQVSKHLDDLPSPEEVSQARGALDRLLPAWRKI